MNYPRESKAMEGVHRWFVIHRIITELHQGEVRFESEYGKGTRFIINLPVAK